MREADRPTRTVVELRLQADRVAQTHAEVHRWFEVDRDRWRQATEAFHMSLSIMYPEHWFVTVVELQNGELHAVEPAIVFLEADPRCFRSGYEKERLCRFLGRVELTDRQRGRLLEIIDGVAYDTRRPQREQRAFARLGARL